MKKYLSFTLLTASFLSLNILPVTAIENIQITNINLEKTEEEKIGGRDYKAIADGQWCVRIPAMGIFCWDL